jgi:pimeloyl-ACP methyl ester carboxylesterase
MPATQTEPKTYTLDAPGVKLTYDIRPNDSSAELPLMIIGSPMGAAGFVTLASHFTDRPVITYDPRGAERSEKTDPTSESTPEQHADDIHRVIQAAAGGGPVDLFASSGGAVNALALVARYPDDVRTLVAHEPPTAQLLPDREAAFAATEDIRDTYQRSGRGPALAKFIALVSYQGEVPADFASRPVDPAMFGLPTEDDGSRNDPLVGQNIITCTHYLPDFDALGRASTSIVLAIGATSGGTMAHRGGASVAERLGKVPVVFPGGHDGFLGGEYGGMGEPDAFAANLREVLADHA